MATYPIPIGPLDWVSTFGPVVATYKKGGSVKSHLCWEAYPDGGVSCGRPNQFEDGRLLPALVRSGENKPHTAGRWAHQEVRFENTQVSLHGRTVGASGGAF